MKSNGVKITMLNYKSVLPEDLHEQAVQKLNRIFSTNRVGTTLTYKDGALNFSTVED